MRKGWPMTAQVRANKLGIASRDVNKLTFVVVIVSWCLFVSGRKGRA